MYHHQFCWLVFLLLLGSETMPYARDPLSQLHAPDLVSTFTSAPHTLVLFALPSLHLLCVHNTEKLFSLVVFIFYCTAASRTNKKPTFKHISKLLSLAPPTQCLWTGSASSMFCRKQRAGPGKMGSAGGREAICWQFSAELSTLVRGSQSPAGQEPLSAVTLECCQAALRISKHVPTTFCFSYLS